MITTTTIIQQQSTKRKSISTTIIIHQQRIEDVNDNGGSQLTAQQQGEGCADSGCGSKGVVRVDRQRRTRWVFMLCTATAKVVQIGRRYRIVSRIDLATMEVMGSGCCARATAMVVQIGKR